MFTGIIQEVGTVEALEVTADGARIRVRAAVANELRDGDSVSVNGVCLTVATSGAGGFEADLMNQTLSVTTLGGLGAGGHVNLEPALRAGDPLGGHLVQGHADGTGLVTSVSADGFARRLAIAVPDEVRRYVAARGSVAVDGVSLTVSALGRDGLEVSLIPETLERTTLGELEAGSEVNVEVDVVARYAERLMEGLNERREG
ncbi:MAG TPA: riboflavin synthase [Solirubrobacterales bacterium]|nr:riboflavin synthase [Solirubrobacterales bacterium]